MDVGVQILSLLLPRYEQDKYEAKLVARLQAERAEYESGSCE